jgi:hypothetical protein
MSAPHAPARYAATLATLPPTLPGLSVLAGCLLTLPAQALAPAKTAAGGGASRAATKRAKRRGLPPPPPAPAAAAAAAGAPPRAASMALLTGAVLVTATAPSPAALAAYGPLLSSLTKEEWSGALPPCNPRRRRRLQP